MQIVRYSRRPQYIVLTYETSIPHQSHNNNYYCVSIDFTFGVKYNATNINSQSFKNNLPIRVYYILSVTVRVVVLENARRQQWHALSSHVIAIDQSLSGTPPVYSQSLPNSLNRWLCYQPVEAR